MPPAESASRPLPRYCEDRNAGELLITAIVAPCVLRSHPITQMRMRDQDNRFPEQRPIGLFERRIEAAMVVLDAEGGERSFTGILLAGASGAGTFYMASDDDRIRCSGDSNIREGVGSGTCTDGQRQTYRLSYRFAPQAVRSNGSVIGQLDGGQGRVAFGWGQDASIPTLRARMQTPG